MAKRKNENAEIKRSMTAVRGNARREHFANGGTVATWRGPARTMDNKTKARASKQACRGRVRNFD
jgi:hypothetical protein